MLTRLHHIALIVSDYKRSLAFYTDILGFELMHEVYREERNSWKADLCLNGQYLLELFSFPDPPARPSYPEAAGLRHLAFTVEKLEPCMQHLEEAGISYEPIRLDPYTKKRFMFFADPDGLPIELCESQSLNL